MARSYMEYSRNYFYNLRKYGLNLSKKELIGSLATIAVVAFVFSFRQWGDETFNLVAGLTNLLLAAAMAAIALFFNQLGQRLIATYYGYDPEYEASMLGIMLSLVLAFASRGLFVVFLPGYVVLHMLTGSRLGEFRYYTNLWEWAKSLFGAPLFNLGLACFLGSFRNPSPFVTNLIKMNVMFALYSLLPLPTNIGLHMFWYYKYFWGFAVAFTVGGVIML